MADRVQRQLSAILAADVAGYSRLVGIDEEGTLSRLKALHRTLIVPKIDEHRGRIVKTMGDGLLVQFASAVDALRCAVDIQRGLAGQNAGTHADRRLEFRIGINVGDVVVDGDDIFGEGVNVAARLEALAEPGSICVSQSVYDQVRGAQYATDYSHGYLAACYAQMGQQEKATQQITEALQLSPQLSVQQFLAKEPLSRAADRERLMEGLRKAGLPE